MRTAQRREQPFVTEVALERLEAMPAEMIAEHKVDECFEHCDLDGLAFAGSFSMV